MRTIASTLLTVAVLAAAALPAAAQEDEPVLPVTVITNAEFCDLLGQDPLVCEGIITGMATAGIVPEAFANLAVTEIAVEAPSAEPGADASGTPVAESTVEPSAEASAMPAKEAGVGDTLSRDDLKLTLVKADWKPDISDSFYQPGEGQKYVSFLVRYEALEDGAEYNIIFWDAIDKAGTRYEAEVLGQIEPDLTVGQLASGKKVQGWVTYEVPQDVNQLQVIESQVLQDDLSWTSKR